MSKRNKMIYGTIGIVLIVLTIFTNQTGLREENIEVYKGAMNLQKKAEGFGFRDFSIEDYPVAFYDGTYDYVVTNTKEGYEIKRRQPVLSTFAATAWEVDGKYQVLCPTVEKFQGMMELFTTPGTMMTMEEEETTELTEEAYSAQDQIATLWHEAFHCYQFSYYAQNIESFLVKSDISQNNTEETNLLMEEIEQNEEVISFYEKELKLLEKAANTEQIDTLKDIVLEYKLLDDSRKQLLSDECIALETCYTVLEGSAHYVEYKAYGEVTSKEEAEEHFLHSISKYQAGNSKYYEIGMAQCIILDKINPEWKKNYDFSKEFSQIIYEEMGLE